MRHLGFLATLRESLGDAWKAVFLIWAVMFIRAVAGQAFITFMPVYFVEQGFSVVAAGMVFALFTVSGTFSGLLAGLASDRYGLKPVFLICHLLMAPALLLLLQVEGNWVYLGSMLAGGMVLSTLPLGVVMAQELAPKGRSMVASLMMGFAYGLGGLVSPVVGTVADHYSTHTALLIMAFVPVLTVPVIAWFPRVK
jgi:FSR family fosmidomycin resistance protein-like MFS transporter